LTDLVVELSDLKVGSNGGDPEAREKIQAIYDLLDNAIEGHSLHPIDLMMTGKIFSDAGLAVPDSLRKAMTEALQAAPPDTQGVAGNDIVSPFYNQRQDSRSPATSTSTSESPQIFLRFSSPRRGKFWFVAGNRVFQQHP
jgi:hypothetical protein